MNVEQHPGESRLHYLVRVAAHFAGVYGGHIVRYDDAQCDGYCLAVALIHEALPEIERLEAPAPAVHRVPYRHRTKGGAYALVGRVIGAGTRRGTELVIYQALDSGLLFCRDQEDFDAQMEEVR